MGAIFTDDTGNEVYQSGFTGEEIDDRLAKAHTALQPEDTGRVFEYNSVALHASLYRGKSLGDSFTDAQKSAVSSGKFDDLYVGDYWTINGTVYRIVDIDYWYNQGDTACTLHHLVIMPDKILYNHVMNNEDSVTGGYVNSKMRTEGLEEAKNMIKAAFGAEHILNHREYLSNAVTDGYESAEAWEDSIIEIPNEIMLCGTYIRKAMNCGSFGAKTATIDKTQLAAMRANSLLINPYRQAFWIRDVVSSVSFSYLRGRGEVNDSNCSNSSVGVRPVFGIIGNN